MENANEKPSGEMQKASSPSSSSLSFPSSPGNNAPSTTQKNLPEKQQEANFLEKYLPEILSGLASMGGSYMLWIKPLQDRMDSMSKQISELRDDLREVQQENKQLRKELERKEMERMQQSSDPYAKVEYLPSRRSSSSFPPMRRV